MTRNKTPQKRFGAAAGMAGALAVLLAFWNTPTLAQNIYDADWGANYSNCSGAKQAERYRAGNYEGADVLVSGVITCRDDGDAYVYGIDYMNFALSPGTSWKNARIDWIGAGAQRDGGNGRNEWIYDEVRPVRVDIRGSNARVSIANLSFRVPKATLAKA